MTSAACRMSLSFAVSTANNITEIRLKNAARRGPEYSLSLTWGVQMLKQLPDPSLKIRAETIDYSRDKTQNLLLPTRRAPLSLYLLKLLQKHSEGRC